MASNIPTKIRQYVRDELKGVYTVSMVVVESVEMEKMRCEVSLKRDKDLLIDNVPIASIFGQANGYGLVVPITPGETEGFVLHTKEPIEDLVIDSGHQEIDIQRQFSPMDAVFFPSVWNENDTTPTESYSDYKEGDYLISHQSDTIIQIKGSEHDDPGTVTIETSSGHIIKLDETDGIKAETSSGHIVGLNESNGIKAETSSGHKATLNEDNGITVKTSSGQGMKLDESTGQLKILDKSGYGLISDGNGNLEMLAKSFNFSDTPESGL